MTLPYIGYANSSTHRNVRIKTGRPSGGLFCQLLIYTIGYTVNDDLRYFIQRHDTIEKERRAIPV